MINYSVYRLCVLWVGDSSERVSVNWSVVGYIRTFAGKRVSILNNYNKDHTIDAPSEFSRRRTALC